MGDNIHLLRYRNQTPETSDPNSKKKNKFTSASFRGLGCTQAQAQVSVPALIRTSANWEPKKLKKKKKKLPTNPAIHNHPSLSFALSSSSSSSSDVWCGPGMGLLTDAASPSVQDCVVSPRPAAAAAARPRIHISQREPPCTVRRVVIPEDNPFVESDAGLGITRSIRTNVSGPRHHHRHVRRAFREGLAEIVMLQSSLLMGGRLGGLDRYQDLRLDVDRMSYEELVELGDRIGYVSTGLREDEITRCLRRTKLATLLKEELLSETEKKCSICQEEYERDDETGSLSCGHLYHIDCIKQWLGQKNTCPVCKKAASSQA